MKTLLSKSLVAASLALSVPSVALAEDDGAAFAEASRSKAA
jgi:hypothetical protein